MPKLEVLPSLVIPEEELQFQFVRSSGPGGQNVNKTSTKAVLHWNVQASPSLPEAIKARFCARFASRLTSAGELVMTSQRSRSQAANITDCLDRLKAMIEGVLQPPKPRRPTKPTKGSQVRRRENKALQARKKQSRGFGPKDE